MLGQTPNFVVQVQSAAPYLVAALLLLVIVVCADNWPEKPKNRRW